MAKRAIEFEFTGTTTPYSSNDSTGTPYSSYDSTKTNLGDLIVQYSGSNPTDNFAGPIKIGVGRPDEASTPIPGIYPHVVSWADKKGFYSTGTVTVTGTNVTGSGTAWLARGVPIGARIGFGASDNSGISTWYTIMAINSDTSITLQTSAGTIPALTSFVIDMTLQKDWVFFADNATAALTRRISTFIFDRTTSVFSWQGFITMTYPTGGGVQTIRGLRVVYSPYTTGTVGVSAATVTGSGTTWSADRIFVGSRIGFGSADPTQIATWYYINAVNSDNSITIQTNVTASGTGGNAASLSISSTTPYVIEDLRVLTATSAAVIASAGLTMAAGLSYDDFVVGGVSGTTIAAATTVDKTKAVYSLVDLDVAYNTGTVTVPTSTTVTGLSTVWTAALHLGCMIGFGSSNPASITTWYTITAVASNTSLTISSAATVSGGTAYVIVGGNGISGGLGLDAKASWTQQYCYVIEVQAATTPQIYKYNFRANLAVNGGVAAGKSPGAFVLVTGLYTVTGNVSQANNGRIGILNHGPGIGVNCLYFVTTTRVYRAPIASITSASTTWVADGMTEIPTGGINTYTATGALSAVEIADQIDRLIITSTSAVTTAHHRAYMTQYDSSGSRQFDQMFLTDTAQNDQSTADSNSVPYPTAQGAALNVWSQGGVVYLSRTGVATTNNITYAAPLGADWTFATGNVNQRLITPALSTVNAVQLSKVFVNNAMYLGGGGLTMPTEPFRIYYRTSGITDDSGTWTLVGQTGDISGAIAGSQIQFAIEFRTIGAQCLPNRIYNICCTYEDNTTDSHYQPSVGESSTSSKYFAWRFSTAFGTAVPELQVQLFDAVSGALLLTDTTVSPTGTWKQSTDGGTTWVTYTTADKTNDTTYIRYAPASLGDNIKVRALLTQA